MKWRIAERKIKFVNKIMEREDNNITKRVLMSEVLTEINGLAHECKIISERIGIENGGISKLSNGVIKKAIEEIDKKEKRDDLIASKKAGD